VHPESGEGVPPVCVCVCVPGRMHPCFRGGWTPVGMHPVSGEERPLLQVRVHHASSEGMSPCFR
jgi:hypothetical protein